jgi:hypothetical protein
LYAFAVVAVVVNAVGIVSFGYGIGGLQKTVGVKRKRNVASASIITIVRK